MLLARSVFYDKAHPRDYTLLRRRLRELAATRVRYGYRRLMVLLRREGINNCHMAVYSLHRRLERVAAGIFDRRLPH